jgi:thiol-disulfide isomerase/thioredoxin
MTFPNGSADDPSSPESTPGDNIAQGYTRRDRDAAVQRVTRRADVRFRLILVAVAIIAVIAVVVALVIVKTNAPKTPVKATTPNSSLSGAALASVVTQLTSVPAATFDQVGAGTASAHPNVIGPAGGTPAAPALTVGGKPEMVYMGAEFCPYCAAERWAMIAALSRFGTFTGLASIKSATTDGSGAQEPFPATNTWTFRHATYTSTFLAFTPVELFTNIPDQQTGGYTTLQKPTAAQQALISKYDAPPFVPSQDQGAIPFIDYGGKFLSVGASYNPGVLSGLSWAQIAGDLHAPASPVAKGVLGAANLITAALCELTGGQPATACTTTVRSLESRL